MGGAGSGAVESAGSGGGVGMAGKVSSNGSSAGISGAGAAEGTGGGISAGNGGASAKGAANSAIMAGPGAGSGIGGRGTATDTPTGAGAAGGRETGGLSAAAGAAIIRDFALPLVLFAGFAGGLAAAGDGDGDGGFSASVGATGGARTVGGDCLDLLGPDLREDVLPCFGPGGVGVISSTFDRCNAHCSRETLTGSPPKAKGIIPAMAALWHRHRSPAPRIQTTERWRGAHAAVPPHGPPGLTPTRGRARVFVRAAAARTVIRWVARIS